MKNLFITGANRGIGLALVKNYTSQGWKVYAQCRHSSPELEATGAVVLSGIELTNREHLQTLKSTLASVELDLLINNAGILGRETLGNLDFDAIEQQFAVNTLAPLQVTETLLGNLRSNAKLAFITSRMGSIADNSSGGYYGYRMSKAALNAAAMSLAKDLQPRGISVAILHPGFVQTGMVNFNGDISAEESAKGLVARINDLCLQNSGTFWHSNGSILPW